MRFVRKYVRFVNLQIVDMPTGFVRFQPFIDCSFQRERGISLRAHVSAVANARGAQLKTGNNTSAISNHQSGAGRASFRAGISIEVAILEYKSASQETNSLVDNCPKSQ